MMRKMWPGLLAILASALFAAVMFHKLPERVASHWGADGVPNGWSSRTTFLIGIHAIGVLLAFVFSVAPSLDPKRSNFPSHQGAYWLVANMALVLLAGVAVFSVGVSAGWNMRVQWAGYAIALLFVTLGNVLTRVRPNWIFGLRTPWSLSSEKAWRASHRVAGYGFVLLGFAVAATTAVRFDAVVIVLLVGALTVCLLSAARSYVVWKNDPTITHPS